MLKPRSGADLGQEPLGAESRAEVWMEHLYRDVAIVSDVMGQIHGGHAALSDLAVYAIAIRQCFSESVDQRLDPFPLSTAAFMCAMAIPSRPDSAVISLLGMA